MEDLEARTIRKVSARLIPFLMICYFIAYLDRVNVGFAALTMNKSLGLTATMFGFGSGVFFLTYFVFEVPSNLALDRFGARKWIARIMLSWGILSGLMAFIPHIARATGLGNDVTFYLVRLLLGAAEAGFFPGIIFYLTLWYPSVYRGRIIGAFMAAIPLSSAIGSPISGMILGMHGIWGLEGWQWLFIIEAAPAVVLAFVTYFYLTDRPTDATWLAPDERSWLTGRLDAERRQRERCTKSRCCSRSIIHGSGRWLWSISARSPATTASPSGCPKSSRRSACRISQPVGLPQFRMRSAPRSWSGTATTPTARASEEGTPRSDC